MEAVPNFKFPFKHFPGLPADAQSRIRRDFEALTLLLEGQSMFDAIIDSALTASEPGNHKYKNLTDLLASESWTTLFSVGVIQRGTAIVEPGATSLVGKGDLVLTGVDGFTPSSHHVGWDWRQCNTTGNTLVFNNIAIDPTVGVVIGAGGNVIAYNCYFGANVTALNTSSSGASATAWNSVINATWSLSSGAGVQITHTFYNCTITGGLSVGTLFVVNWYGGSIGSTLTLTSSGSGFFYASMSGITTTTTGSPGTDVVIENLGRTGGDVTVNMGGAGVRITGSFGNVTYTGSASSGATFMFEGSATSLDITGPTRVVANLKKLTNPHRLTIRGDSVDARVTINVASSPYVSFVGATNCFAAVQVNGAAGGGQAYTFDAASNHNLLLLAGSAQANFSVASTDAGSNNRVITETNDTLFTGKNAPVNPNLLMGEVAAVQSGVQTMNSQAVAATVDTVHKDMVPGELWSPQEGLNVIGTRPVIVCTSTTHPTGAAVGDQIYETDTGKVLFWAGATDGFTQAWNMPWGVVAAIKSTADQNTAAGSIALASLTKTWTPLANRTYKYTVSLTLACSLDGHLIGITIDDGAGGQISTQWLFTFAQNNGDNSVTFVWVETPGAGSITRRVTMQSDGTSTATHLGSSRPGFFVIEDIGPNGNPS